MNAFSTPERTAAFMQHLDDNSEKITALRKTMKHPGHTMAERIIAFAELYELIHGDPHAQRRLVIELKIEAQKETHQFQGR
ncbi:hypothetical protein [Acinetobacter sp.]|uniref:hypothetical protein n=1 Tax=Acinetobacter sp. TaxID=472 RepID=UPI0038910D28